MADSRAQDILDANAKKLERELKSRKEKPHKKPHNR
jgi:hypothetical protein